MIQIKKEYLFYAIIALAFFFIGRFSKSVTEHPHYQEIQYNQEANSGSSAEEVKNDNYRNSNKDKRNSYNDDKPTRQTIKSQDNVPSKALEVLAYIRQYNEAPDGYVGGRTFQNRERLLPQKDDNGDKINYQEWDIYPKIKNRNRGAERLVTSQKEAYYTGDHYRSFIKIQE